MARGEPVVVALERQEEVGQDQDQVRKVAALLETARKRYQFVINAESRLRQAEYDDLRFHAGEQWLPELKRQRQQDQRPCLTIPRIQAFVRQVTNQMRSAKPAILVAPVEDADVKTAEVYQGIIRHIEQQSDAISAYSTAIGHQVPIGRGYWLVTADFSDPKSFDLELQIRRVRNQFSVALDPARLDPTGSDARFGFITEDIPRDEYEARYGADQLASLTLFMSVGDSSVQDWMPQGKVRLAQYWWVDETPTTLVLVRGSDGSEVAMAEEEFGDLVAEIRDTLIIERDGSDEDLLAAAGFAILNRREVRARQVKWALIDAEKILEGNDDLTDGAPWPGQWIPIVCVVGEEIDLDGVVDYKGMVRDAIDTARTYDYWVPLALDTPLPTPTGWTTMGDVQPGATLFDARGRPCAVKGISPIHEGRECFRVVFDDGTSIVADEEHPWAVEERGGRITTHTRGVKGNTWEWHDKVVTTGALTPKKHFIRVAEPLKLTSAELPVDPYVFGVWLGDGTAAGARLAVGKRDLEELSGLLRECGVDVGTPKWQRTAYSVWLHGGIHPALRRLGVLGRKHIPEIYLRASCEQRLALLQGLMDTDGSISRRGQCSFSTSDPSIRDGYAELLRSLGVKAVRCERQRRASVFPNGKTYQPAVAWQFSFSPKENLSVFRLGRKKAIEQRPHRYTAKRTERHAIVSVERVPSVPVKCLAIESEHHLFLAGPGMVPTHNTAMTEAIALAPLAPWIIESGQVEPFQSFWSQANRRTMAYLPYRGVSLEGHPLPPPSRNFGEPPGLRAMMVAIQQHDADLKAITGRYAPSLGEREGDESGRAILALQRQGEVSTGHYGENFARALRWTGRLLLDLIPKVYTAPRVLRILGADDVPHVVMVHSNAEGVPEQPPSGIEGIYNLGAGKFDVTVSAGPSQETKRQEAVAAMVRLGEAAPQAIPLMMDVLVGEMDWPKAQVLAERFKKMLPPQLQEQKGPGGEEMTPQTQALMAQHEKLTQALQQATEMLESKRVEKEAEAVMKQTELATRERIAIIQAETKTEIEAAKLASERAKMTLEAQIHQLERRFDAILAQQAHNEAGAKLLAPGQAGAAE